MKSSATIVTAAAGRYMSQLCKHFGHRVPTVLGERKSQITFEAGEVHLRASPATLMIMAEAAQEEAIARLEDVVERHLKRFAFREPHLTIEWRRAPLGAAID